jgi:hypothetical protein
MHLEREEILKKLTYFRNEYVNIKHKLVEFLDIVDFKKNSELNELIHIKLYDVNKIIGGFNKNIVKLNNDKTFELNEEKIYEYFNDKFLDKMTELVTNIKYQISVIENNIN